MHGPAWTRRVGATASPAKVSENPKHASGGFEPTRERHASCSLPARGVSFFWVEVSVPATRTFRASVRGSLNRPRLPYRSLDIRSRISRRYLASRKGD